MELDRLPRYGDFKALRFVRDNHPTEEELIQFFGNDPTDWKVLAKYSQIRRSGMAILEGERWVLNPRYISADGKWFGVDHEFLNLDEEIINVY